MTATFPSATIIGYPRIGTGRELKRAVEAYWAGRSSLDELQATAAQLRVASYARLRDLGLTEDSAIPATFSYYDQVLDATTLLGAIPARFEDGTERAALDQYFLLARGQGAIAPLEMTKWFNTNYHYLVPEIGPDTTIRLAATTPIDRFEEARAAGFTIRPTLVGPLTYLLLAKPAVAGYNPLDRLEDVVAVYAQLLAAASAAGVPWFQLDEPALTSDNLGVTEAQAAELALRVYQELGSLSDRPALLVTTPYGGATAGVASLAQTPVEAIHADLVHGPVTGVDLGDKTLVAGIINGRNIWRADLSARLADLRALDAANLSVATSTSLQHVPYTTATEEWDSAELDANLHLWLAFADEKVAEVVALATGLAQGDAAIADQLSLADRAVASRNSSAGVNVDAVRQRVAGLTDADRRRAEYPVRRDAQAARFQLPPLPSTTIGSFPQTPRIRQARAAAAAGTLSASEYRDVLRAEVAEVIKLQEDIGFDVLVHGEPERNDMVQYFAELLDGFAVTRGGWVQSYGSRCTRPSILWGDVSRPAPMTVEWATYAQSLTEKPVKGMLTGPVTILAWSFVRDDLPIGQVADQVGLALRDEVADLEAAGIGIIQVDEPALRELLPLRRADQPGYLDWSIGSFRASTAVAAPETQIHTHLCYSEFGDVIDAIDALDADVTSLEAARSHMEVLPALTATGFARQIGPGLYDIHSPRVPSVEELTALLREAVAAVPADRLWVNPDCGLKTRTYAETTPALENLIAAGLAVRAEL